MAAASAARAVRAAAGSPLLEGGPIMTSKPQNKKKHQKNETPKKEPRKSTRELSEDDLKQVAGGVGKINVKHG
jgi:hypothetical protein